MIRNVAEFVSLTSPYIIGVLLQCGSAFGYVAVTDGWEKDRKTEFLKDLDTAQAFPAVITLLVSGFLVPGVDGLDISFLVGFSGMAAFGSYLLLKSFTPNQYESWTLWIFSRLNVALMVANILLGLLVLVLS